MATLNVTSPAGLRLHIEGELFALPYTVAICLWRHLSRVYVHYKHTDSLCNGATNTRCEQQSNIEGGCMDRCYMARTTLHLIAVDNKWTSTTQRHVRGQSRHATNLASAARVS